MLCFAVKGEDVNIEDLKLEILCRALQRDEYVPSPAAPHGAPVPDSREHSRRSLFALLPQNGACS